MMTIDLAKLRSDYRVVIPLETPKSTYQRIHFTH
jgi:hypothetical protein